jgi:hypothetical protein
MKIKYSDFFSYQFLRCVVGDLFHFTHGCLFAVYVSTNGKCPAAEI